jgi:hypothetical protein
MELQEISDRLEIEDLMVSYCYAIDSSNWNALDDVFTPDAVIDYSEMVGVRGNLTQIKAFLAGSLSQVAGFQHAISTTQLRFEGDVARGRTVCFNPITIKKENGETSRSCSWACGIAIRSSELPKAGGSASATRSALTRTTSHPVCCRSTER